MSTTIQQKTYTVLITKDRDEGGFVGRCDELHANSQGETYGETVENMKDAVSLAARTIKGVTEFNMLLVDV